MRGPVCIEWVDAVFEFDSAGTPPDAYDVETYGWIIANNLIFTTVASERLPDNQYRAVTHIPSVLIRRIIDLEEGDRV